MTGHIHPSSGELLAAANNPDRVKPVLDHVGECLACRVRLARLRAAADTAPAGENIFRRLMEAAAQPPAVVASLVVATPGREPQPNEIWRVGRSEALLVWVRRVFDDGVADVVPLVLDVALADEQSVLVPAGATPLASEAVAIVALRTHVHTGAFLNHVGQLDINREVNEVMASVQEGRRPNGVVVGPPIDDDRDQRLEYRQALRDLLAELSPTAWLDAEDAATRHRQASRESATPRRNDTLKSIKKRLSERLPGIRFAEGKAHSVAVDENTTVKSATKASYLDTAVLVITVDLDNTQAWPEIASLAAACLELAQNEQDVDAVVVSVPHRDWPSQLFPLANLRSAYQAPGGARTGPTPALTDHGLVDTLCKHLEGAAPSWEYTEPATDQIGRTNLHQVASSHASTSIERIRKEGRRALQPAKRLGWGELDPALDQRLASLIFAIVNNEDVDGVVAEFIQEAGND